MSLSNKASNPASQPTPQQEAMNKAAEYLVLRMLFLSGHQVMHTAPGATASFAEASAVTAPVPQQQPQQPRVVSSVSAGLASSPQIVTPHGHLTALSGSIPLDDDGTVAASTGTENVAVAQPHETISLQLESADLPNGENEDKVDDT